MSIAKEIKKLFRNDSRFNFMNLKEENILLRDLLIDKMRQLDKILKPGLNFGYIERKNNQKDFFAGLVLNKINSLNISIGNSILANDVFLSVYLYRYIYELYIKIFYIFSGSFEEKSCRLNEFFENKKWIISNIIKEIDDKSMPSEFKGSHYEKYAMMSKIVHPNINSFNLHLNQTADIQFEFLLLSIKLSILHVIGIIKLFLSEKLLNLDKRIDGNALKLLGDDL